MAKCFLTHTHIHTLAVFLAKAEIFYQRNHCCGVLSRFIGSDNHNLKYLGVKGLASIVKDHPRYAAQHQVRLVERTYLNMV